MAGQVLKLAAGQSTVVIIGDGIRLTLIPGAGSTITYSRVDDRNATEHGPDSVDVAAADGPTAITPDWPQYFVSVAGGTARVGVS